MTAFNCRSSFVLQSFVRDERKMLEMLGVFEERGPLEHERCKLERITPP